MTTNVTVNAHCAEDTEVYVEIYDKETGIMIETDYLQNKDTKVYYVYDNRFIRIGEIKKNEI